MQLAASQRAHPPPVPPRPSRQVVAEALKRSPRPPCPTRQAPPPPNTKPWRSGEQDVSSNSAGRTVVYESSKEAAEDRLKVEESKVENESRIENESSVEKESKFEAEPKVEKESKSLSRSDSTSQEEKLKIEKEPRVEKELSRLEKEPKIRRESKLEKEPKVENSKSQDTNLTQREIYQEVYPDEEESIESPLPQSRRPSVESLLENEIYELVEECRLKNLEKRDGQDPKEIRLGDIQLDPSRPRLRSQKMSCLARERARSKNKDEIDGPQVGNGQRPLVKGPKPQQRTNLVRPPVPARNNLVQVEERREVRVRDSKAGKSKLGDDARIAGRPALPLKPRQRFDSSSSNSTVTKDGTGSEKNKSILSDDGATVVIIDEPERKVVAFNEDGDNIHHQDWLEAGVRYSSTQITLSGDEASDRVNGFAHLEDEVEFSDLDFSSILERIAMSSLQGLPPLPRSLSGFNLNSGRGEAGEPPPPPTRSSSKAQRSAKTLTNVTQSSSRPSPPARQLTTLDTQLAILRREMFGLRQLDLSLLSQLWSLNESIQEFRQLLQEQEDRAPSPSPSSEEGDDTSYGTPPRRPAPTLHHHRPPRPPRPPKPPPSDESPSSEEYGAV